METITPHAELDSFVESYWAWEIPAASGELDPLLPDAAPELIFHLATPPKALRTSGLWEQQGNAFLLCASRAAVRLVVEAPMGLVCDSIQTLGSQSFHCRLHGRTAGPRSRIGGCLSDVR